MYCCHVQNCLKGRQFFCEKAYGNLYLNTNIEIIIIFWKNEFCVLLDKVQIPHFRAFLIDKNIYLLKNQLWMHFAKVHIWVDGD